MLAGALSLGAALLATTALFLPSSYRLWPLWSWNADSLRWELVGCILALTIAGIVAMTFGRKDRRWALGCVAAAFIFFTHFISMWALSSTYYGFFDLPSLKSFAVLFALAATTGSAGIVIGIAVLSDRPILRIDTALTTKGLIVGAFLTLSSLVSLQWATRDGNFFSIYAVGFGRGASTTVVVALLVTAIGYVLILTGGTLFGPSSARASGMVVAGAWFGYLASGLTGLGRQFLVGSVWPGIGFVVAVAGAGALAWFIREAARTESVESDSGALSPQHRFPFVAAVRTAAAIASGYLLLLWPLHTITTEDATIQRILVVTIGFIVIEAAFVAIWKFAPRIVDGIEHAAADTATTT